jgi:hypothetical protein
VPLRQVNLLVGTFGEKRDLPLQLPRVVGGGEVPCPLPIELRTRVVEAYLEGDSTIDEVAARFKVGSATLKR